MTEVRERIGNKRKKSEMNSKVEEAQEQINTTHNSLREKENKRKKIKLKIRDRFWEKVINSEDREKSTYIEENQSKGKGWIIKTIESFPKITFNRLEKTLRREFVKLRKLTQMIIS